MLPRDVGIVVVVYPHWTGGMCLVLQNEHCEEKESLLCVKERRKCGKGFEKSSESGRNGKTGGMTESRKLCNGEKKKKKR